MAGVGHLQRGQLVDVRVDDGGERPQRSGPIGGGQCGPRPLRDLGARHGVVDAGLVDLFDGAQHLLGGRVDQSRGAHAFTFPVA